MAIDPICGMEVDPATDHHVERDGRTHYFCSAHCREKFLAGPTPARARAPARTRARCIRT